MDGGEKNIYQTLSLEIWMEERKTYNKHFHLRYGRRREKTYTKHCHLSYGWRREKHIPNIFI
jgi:hypothetical protein